MATHSSPLALKIPWTEELGAGYDPRGRKESGTTERLHFLSIQSMESSRPEVVKQMFKGSANIRIWQFTSLKAVKLSTDTLQEKRLK